MVLRPNTRALLPRALSRAALAALLFAASAAAQETNPLAQRQASLAAGYKAGFICSGVFNAGRSPAAIEADELTGVYPDFRAPLAALPPAEIDPARGVVAVRWAQDMPPRLAVWRPGQGCTQLPIGAAAPQETLTVAPGPAGPSPLPWPQGDRLRRAPKPGRALAAVVDRAFADAAYYGAGAKTSAVLIVQNGQIVAERYAEGFDAFTPQRTWSVAKSLAATVIGAAVGEGLLDPQAPAGLPEWSRPDDPRASITLANLLHMSSGLHSGRSGSRTDEIYFGAGLVAEYAGRNPLEAPPGARWRYANNDTLLAMRALRTRLEAAGRGTEYARYPHARVLDKLGMRHTTPEADWAGDFIFSSQVWTTARDMARLGLLYMNDGVWQGERLLPPGWVQFVTSPAPAQPPRGPGYGAQWWLYGPAEGLPEGVFAARGNRGQFLFVAPAQNVLVVRRGFDDALGEGFDAARFTADVLAAL